MILQAYQEKNRNEMHIFVHIIIIVINYYWNGKKIAVIMPFLQLPIVFFLCLFVW